MIIIVIIIIIIIIITIIIILIYQVFLSKVANLEIFLFLNFF